MFYDEEMILDFRLNYLNDFVDKFIVVESSFTHSGKKRDLLFNEKNFSIFKDKISYIALNEEPPDLYDINEEDIAEAFRLLIIAFLKKFNMIEESNFEG